VEFIGSNNPYYDAEIIAILWNYLTGLGLKKLHLELNSVGCSVCAKEYDKALKIISALSKSALSRLSGTL
jgi:histidyl-tRNA synthetase